MERIHGRTVQKDLSEPDCCDDVVSHPEPDILESKVKWALRSIALIKLVDAMKFQENYSDP